MRGSRGHTLVEVLVASLVLVAGLLPVGAALGASARLATRGRARAEAVLTVMRRVEQLRVEALRTTPACGALAAGVVTGPDREEAWSIAGTGPTRTVTVTATVRLPLAWVADTAVVRFRCG